jgi:hypothetical protein
MGSLGCEVQGADAFVMGWWMVFCEVVGQVGGSGGPVDDKLFFVHMVLDTEKVHVNGTGALLFYGIIGNAIGGGVVGLERGTRLGPTKFLQSVVKDDTFCGVDKDGANFSLRGGADDLFEDASGIEDGTIGNIRLGRGVAEVKVASSTAMGSWFAAGAGVAVDFECHVADVKVRDSIGMHGTVVKEVMDSEARVLGGFALFGGESTEGNIHGAVDGTSIVKEGADNLLDGGDVGFL